MTDFGEDGFGRCRGCGDWTRYASRRCPWMALCTTCGDLGRPDVDSLHVALASVLGAYHWRAFCDAWLAVGLAATLVAFGVGVVPFHDEDERRRFVAQAVGRVVRGRRR